MAQDFEMKESKCVNRTACHSACTDGHIELAHHIALILCTPHLGLKVISVVCPKKIFVFCAVFHVMLSTLSTPFSTSLTFTGPHRLITSRIPCDDPWEPTGDGFTNPEPFTGYGPKNIVDNPTITEQEIARSVEESQNTEIEEKGLASDPSSSPYDESLLSFTQDSIETIATPQEADLDDEQIRALLASPRSLPERDANAKRPQVYLSFDFKTNLL